MVWCGVVWCVVWCVVCVVCGVCVWYVVCSGLWEERECVGGFQGGRPGWKAETTPPGEVARTCSTILDQAAGKSPGGDWSLCDLKPYWSNQNRPILPYLPQFGHNIGLQAPNQHPIPMCTEEGISHGACGVG